MIDPGNPDFNDTPVSPYRPAFSYRSDDPKSDPCLTIVTPFYNVGAVFHDTARCVMQQSLQQFEWVIVNDGSTDLESLSILGQYRNTDPRIRVIDHEANKGLPAARNTGFRAARTECVLVLDGDDLIETTTAEKWLWFLTTHPEYSFVNSYTVRFGPRQQLQEDGFHARTSILAGNLLTYCCLSRKTAHASVGGYDEALRKGGEDWEFWVRCADRGYWGYTMPEYLFWYRTRENLVDRWPDLQGDGVASFAKMLSQRHPRLIGRRFPIVREQPVPVTNSVPVEIPFANHISRAVGKRRLLMIVPWMTAGGADKFNLDLMSQLTRKGWEITIATTLDDPDFSWYHEFSRFTPDIFVLPRFLHPSDQPRFMRYLIESRSPDVVFISNSELGYVALPYLRSQSLQATIVDYCHSEVEERKNGGYPGFSINFCEYLDLSFVTSKHLKDWMTSKGGDGEKIAVCYIGVDSDRWKPDPLVRASVRSELETDDRTPIILFVGRIAPEKQPLVLGKVLNSLKEAGLDFLAVVAGDGQDRRQLESYIGKQHLSSRVKLLGAVSSDRVRELMAAADIFFLPSKFEGIALTIYEAMASGVAVVGANVGGQRELVTEDCGILVETGDENREVRDYTEVLTRLIQNPAERMKLGEKARARIEANFRLSDMGDRMVELFDRARALHSSRPYASGEAAAVKDPELLDYINSYVAPDYFGLDIGLFRRTMGLARQARRFYRNYGLPATIKMTLHYVSINRHTPADLLRSQSGAFRRRLTGLSGGAGK